MGVLGGARPGGSPEREAPPVGAVAPETLAHLALILAVLAAASSSIWVRLSGAPAVAKAFWRLAFSIPLVLAPVLLRRRPVAWPRGRDLGLAVASGAFLAAHFATWIASLDYTSVASSTVLVSTHPFLVTAIAARVLGERTPARALAGVALAVAGGALIAWGDWGGGRAVLYGDLLALAGAATFAGYVTLGRVLRRRLDVVGYAATVYGVAAAVLLGVGLLAGVPLAGFAAADWAVFLALAVFPTLLGHTVMNWALGYVRAGLVSVSVLGEPLAGAVLAWFILGDRPGPLVLLGGAVILAGIAWFVRAAQTRGG